MTITASGSFLPDVPLQASGLTLPPGIPVTVSVTGQVTRTQTDGLKLFCSFFVDLCAEFAFFLGEDPVPPSGVPEIDAAVAFAAWDGAEGQRAPESGPVLSGPSGSELWVGRSQFFCEFSWDFGSGPCFTFGGSYTYTVHADSGDESAHLILNVTQQSLGPSGGSVDLEVETSDGSPAEDVRWYFVPDGGGVIDGGEPPIVTARATSATDAPTAPRLVIMGAEGERSAGPSRFAASAGVTATATWTSLSACDGNLTCHATIDVSAGTFVATALVHDTPRAAEQRVSEGSGGGGGAPLHLSCVPEQVQRAQTVTCTASGEPSDATIVIQQWRFTPDDTRLRPIERSMGQDELTWSGPMVTSGTVTVNGTVNGQAGEATAHIAVTDRGPLTATFETPPVTDDDDMSERPYQVAGERGLHHIGHIHSANHFLRFPGRLAVIGQGPNGGLGYYTANPYDPSWKIHINLSQLQANSDLAHLQRESAPAFERTVSCLRSQLPRLVGTIELHEGSTMHPNSHAGRYAAKFNELAGPIIERLVIQDDPDAETSAALEPVITAASTEADKTDDEGFSLIPCTLVLFPAPR
ncbi:MAG: hypothetical protein ACREMN_09250 [Gemmatimonadales bacterium]